MISHLGQNINDHVVLQGSGIPGYWAVSNFRRIAPDGTATTFQVPSGKLLVITDVEWQIFGFRIYGGPLHGQLVSYDFYPGDAAWLVIRAGGGMVFGAGGGRVFGSRTIRVVTKGPGVGTSEQLTTGFVIGSRGLNAFAQVVPREPWPPGYGISGFYGDLTGGFLILRGYLIDAEPG